MNLEKTRHGYEGLNNGGELYGNYSNTNKPISTENRLEELRAIKEFLEQEGLLMEQENETIKQNNINTELKDFIDLMNSTPEEDRGNKHM